MPFSNQWRSKGGAAKLELYLKICGGERYFEIWGKFFMGGDYSENGGNRRQSEKFQTSKKKVVKIRKKKPERGGKSRIRPGRQTP